MADVDAIAELIERRDWHGLRDAVGDWPRPDLEGDLACLFQALIALQDMGENVFGDSSCWSSWDIEKNRAFTRAYLAKTGDT